MKTYILSADDEKIAQQENEIREKPPLWWEDSLDDFMNIVWNRMVEGSIKHGDSRPTPETKDYIAAMLRHLGKHYEGDKSEPHLAAVACCAFMAWEVGQ